MCAATTPQTPKGDADQSLGTKKEIVSDETVKSGDRDKKTLFLKNLPGNYTVRHIKALTKDVRQVRLRNTFALIEGKRTRIGYAYLEYANEAVAEKNFDILSECVVNGKQLVVDYVGAKSNFYSTKSKTEPEDIDPLRLYIRGLPTNATDDDMRKLFPEATEILLPRRKRDKKLFGYGFIGFSTPEIAAKYHNDKSLKFKDNELFVLYAKKRSQRKQKEDQAARRKEANRKEAGGPAAKKFRKQDDDEDDLDEDDDDDEDDDIDDDDDDDDE